MTGVPASLVSAIDFPREQNDTNENLLAVIEGCVGFCFAHFPDSVIVIPS